VDAAFSKGFFSSIKQPELEFIYLFVYDLFNDALRNSDYLASNDLMTVSNDLERMQKEAVAG
jgi:hypothetical protein